MSSDEPDETESALLGELGRAVGHDPEAVPPPARVLAVREAAGRMRAAPLRPSRRQALLTGGIAAAFTGLAGYGVAELREREEPAPPAVPTEPIAFGPSPEAEVATSALVNHTWGTELLLDLTGLSAGAAYAVVFETPTGEVSAGSLVAVPDVLMRCRFLAAPLRADVRAIELRSPDGGVVLRSELPQA